jgi:hypothetical protein
LDRRDLGLGLALGVSSFAAFRATEQVLLFHDAALFRRLLEEGEWRYFHVLWLPVLQIARATGIAATSRDVLYVVSALSGAAIVLGSFAVARLLLPRLAALLLALLVLATPAVWFHASSACVHAFHGAVAVGGFHAAWSLRPGHGLGRRLGAGTAIALVPLSHLAGAFLVPGYLVFAASRGGRLRRDLLRRALPLLAPPLLGLAVLIGTYRSVGSVSFPVRVGEVASSTWAHAPALVRAGIGQATRAMPFLGLAALLGWAAAYRRRRGLVGRSLLVAVPLFLGVTLWMQDLVGAYYLGAVGVLCVGAAHAWRALAARAGRGGACGALAGLVAVQAALCVPARIREADARAVHGRTEALLRTGALLLYEPRVPEAIEFHDLARGRLVLNLFLFDGTPPGGSEAALADLGRASAGLEDREVVLDRRIYEAVRRGSRLAEWFAGFRERFRAEEIPGHADFELLRPKR